MVAVLDGKQNLSQVTMFSKECETRYFILGFYETASSRNESRRFRLKIIREYRIAMNYLPIKINYGID